LIKLAVFLDLTKNEEQKIKRKLQTESGTVIGLTELRLYQNQKRANVLFGSYIKLLR